MTTAAQASCAGNPERVNAQRHLAGIAFGLLAYGIWGFFPLFFRQLAHVSPMDVLSNRAVWACVFVGLLLTLRRQWHKVAAVFQQLAALLMLAVAALLIGSNWLVFLWAVGQSAGRRFQPRLLS
jgi:chloramphenicol-sensitive protein RarD